MFVTFDPDLAAIGWIVPEFVDELDYVATKKIVIDSDIEATWVSEMGSQEPVVLLYHEEPIAPLPIYKTTLRWRTAID